MKTPFQVFFGDISSFALNNLLPLFNKNYSSYVKSKREGEKKLKDFKYKKIKVSILKIDVINTKQNLSILNYKLPNFRDILEKNENYQRKFFFN